ncbi:hypothetical protein [Saccharopolyspora phatthalungensis]|uniref:Uncharacterized protein n=1 Tax=Saccharopolyspora phatthalungensis TaxID=664693 RepID=A0A840QFL5_9PSEU|nr:hypothetical protein [Saccharopolyspora phatthalungensis]MBB5158720.1 hypothetical protein [Saccharopolyspora phatthalungensis]
MYWLAYVGISSDETGSSRAERLDREPERVLRTPVEAVSWIAHMTAKHAHCTTVLLLGPRDGTGHVGDDRHIAHDAINNLDALRQGDSVYQDFARENDRMHLWVEAVTTNGGSEVHHDKENRKARPDWDSW